MYADKMPVKTIAEPIAVFRLECEHLEHFVVTVFPGVVVGIQVQGRFFTQADFGSEIDGFGDVH